jgi:hypothetical protein
MSASAVRGGQVYVEIGANPSKLLNALRIVNTQIGNLGSGMASVGKTMAVAGSAIAGPIMAAGTAFASQNAEVLRAQASLVSLGEAVGSAVAPAVVGASNAIAGMAEAAARFVRENEELVRQVLAVGSALVGVGTLLFTFGEGLSIVSRLAGNIGGPILSLVKIIGTLAGSLITIATSGPVLAIAAVLGGIAVAARVAGVDLAKMAGSLRGSFDGPINDAKALLADLGETTSTTITGVYNSIAAGDIAGAIDILWAGVNAAWLRGQAAILGVIEPWVSLIQNTFDVLGTYVVSGLDLLSTDAGNAVRKVSSVVMGIFDELANGVMATFDMMIGNIQKAWIRITGFLQGATDTQSKLDAIDKDNQSRADQRGKDRPGLAARMNEAIGTNATESQAASDRQSAAMSDLDKRMMGREDANRQRAADRMAAVDQAKTALDQKVAQTSAPASISGGSAPKMSTSVAGTFSATAVGQMGGGNVQKQQLDALLKIQAGIDQANRVGGIVA